MNKHDFLASLWEELDLPFDVEDVQEIEAVLDNNAVYIDFTATYSPAPNETE